MAVVTPLFGNTVDVSEWDGWLAAVEDVLDRSADGHQRSDGYSVEAFRAMFDAGKSPRQAAERIVGAVFLDPVGNVYRLTEVGLSVADKYVERCRVHTAGGNATSFSLPDDVRLVWHPLGLA